MITDDNMNVGSTINDSASTDQDAFNASEKIPHFMTNLVDLLLNLKKREMD